MGVRCKDVDRFPFLSPAACLMDFAVEVLINNGLECRRHYPPLSCEESTDVFS